MSTFDDLYEKALAAAAPASSAGKARKPKAVKPSGAWAKDGHIKLDADLIAKMRGEFLQLMKAAGQAKNYDEAIKVKVALRVWREKLEEFLYDDFLKHEIWELVSEHPNVGGVRDHQKLQEWVTYWKKKLGKETWDLKLEVGSMPIDYSESALATRGAAYSSPEYLFARYAENRERWLAKAKRAALKAWKALEEFVSWMGTKMKPIKVGTNESATIEGFRTKILRFGTSSHDNEAMSLVPAGLRHFRDRARRVYPWLIKEMLPMELRFRCDLDEGGKYHYSNRERYIEICVSNVVLGKKSPAEHLARIIAHEMGHHVWKTKLTPGRRKLWEAYIAEDRGPVDLRKTLACWRRSGKDTFFGFLDWLQEHDPVTYVKMEALVESSYLADEGLKGKLAGADELEDLIERKGKAVVQAPRNPITVYANKNPEEAFCEAFSIAVAIGPRGLLPAVRGWLKETLPDINLS